MTRSLRARVLLPILVLAVGAGSLPLVLACSGPPPLTRAATPRVDPGPAVSTSTLALTDGEQSGAMGEIVGFDGVVSRNHGDYYGPSAYIRLDSEGLDWWVMSSLSITGDLAGDDFAPGTHRVYTSGVADPTGTNVDVLGCSGPSYGNYTFDTHAGSVEVTVSEVAPGVRHLDFVTGYGDQVTRGGFDYRVTGTAGTTDPRGI
jgi:hypothetical protein